MAPRKKPVQAPDKFAELATAYGIEDNAIFLSTLDTYKVQIDVIQSIKEAINESDQPTVDKEYVKGRKNIYIHPAVKELPRHADSLGKTAATLLSIIKELGSPPVESGDEFDEF